MSNKEKIVIELEWEVTDPVTLFQKFPDLQNCRDEIGFAAIHAVAEAIEKITILDGLVELKARQIANADLDLRAGTIQETVSQFMSQGPETTSSSSEGKK